MKILSFGAGMQSTALAHMACENAKAKDDLPYPAVPVYDAVVYDGSKWWTTWQDCQKTRVKKKLAQEIDAFHTALFDMPEMKNLASMTGLQKYAEPTEERTEFNLYSETEHFYIWLRFILREKDYNNYCHYYLK